MEVSGTGSDTARWSCEPVELRAGACYRFSVSTFGVDTAQGCLPCGVDSFTRDFRPRNNEWSDESYCFRFTGNDAKRPVRVGQWKSNGTYQFKNIRLEPVTPIYREFPLVPGRKPESLILGEGETIRDGVYRFHGWFAGEAANVTCPNENGQ